MVRMVRRICCGNGNCYLISNGKNAILVDTGREKYRQKILDACKPYNVRLLVLTHGHVDHIQNAAFLSNALICPIAMHEADISLIADNMLQPLHAHSILGKIVLAASIKSFHEDKILSFTPNISLKEGDALEDYGIPAKIIGLPGHTQGSIGIDIMGKELIVGDALMNMFYPTVSMLYNDRDTMLQSAHKISGLGERQIYFGHGKPKKNRSAWR
jgi:glyoxylase-like metal-dependent hydrolase (beta-lactamase superfamily II)